jgi:hypothetical protein
MLNRDVDYALVGHNFYAFLLSIGLLQKGKKVLVLDDNRFNYGDFFTSSLTCLDVALLKEWGAQSQLEPLKNLDQYLSPTNVTFNIGKRQFVLGDSPHRNMRELARKYPEVFLPPNLDLDFFKHEHLIHEFNSQFFELGQVLAAQFYKPNKKNNFNQNFFQVLPIKCKEFYDHFLSLFLKPDFLSVDDQADFHAFVFMMRGFFQSRLSVTGSKLELLHLLTCLISPFYKLDHERLVQDLLSIHSSLGGEFKKLNLSDLKFQQGLLKSFELESFDGVIKPQKVAFIGGYPVGLPIKLKTGPSRSFYCLQVKLKFKSELLPLFRQKKFVFTSKIKVGTDRPFWEVNFDNHSATFNLITNKKEGTKIDFIKDKMLDLLLSDLRYLFPESEWEIEENSTSDMHFTLDVFLEDKNFKAHLKNNFAFKKRVVDVFEDSAPLFMSSLKNVTYFGPYNEEALGTYSSLIEMKNWRDRL